MLDQGLVFIYLDSTCLLKRTYNFEEAERSQPIIVRHKERKGENGTERVMVQKDLGNHSDLIMSMILPIQRYVSAFSSA